MTSINAMRFNKYSGIMICDEQRGWNEENLKIYAVEKGKPVIEDFIQNEQGLVAGYANTGTSTIGDELRFSIRSEISRLYNEKIEIERKIPSAFLSMSDVADIAYSEICKLKHKHINDELIEKFGFDTNDFIRGYYMKDGNKIEIKDKEIINEINERITWKKRGELSRAVFLNAGIIAGYSPIDGFNIYHLSMIDGFCEPVETAFVADGSGCDTANIWFANFLKGKSAAERARGVDPIEGVMAAIHALNIASETNLGVGGYFNIIYFNGQNANRDRVKLINDHRAKLAAEAVLGYTNGFLLKKDCAQIIKGIVFGNMKFEQGNSLLFSKVSRKDKFKKLLYGFKENRV